MELFTKLSHLLSSKPQQFQQSSPQALAIITTTSNDQNQLISPRFNAQGDDDSSIKEQSYSGITLGSSKALQTATPAVNQSQTSGGGTLSKVHTNLMNFSFNQELQSTYDEEENQNTQKGAVVGVNNVNQSEMNLEQVFEKAVSLINSKWQDAANWSESSQLRVELFALEMQANYGSFYKNKPIASSLVKKRIIRESNRIPYTEGWKHKFRKTQKEAIHEYLTLVQRNLDLFVTQLRLRELEYIPFDKVLKVTPTNSRSSTPTNHQAKQDTFIQETSSQNLITRQSLKYQTPQKKSLQFQAFTNNAQFISQASQGLKQQTNEEQSDINRERAALYVSFGCDETPESPSQLDTKRLSIYSQPQVATHDNNTSRQSTPEKEEQLKVAPTKQQDHVQLISHQGQSVLDDHLMTNPVVSTKGSFKQLQMMQNTNVQSKYQEYLRKLKEQQAKVQEQQSLREERNTKMHFERKSQQEELQDCQKIEFFRSSPTYSNPFKTQQEQNYQSSISIAEKEEEEETQQQQQSHTQKGNRLPLDSICRTKEPLLDFSFQDDSEVQRMYSTVDERKSLGNGLSLLKLEVQSDKKEEQSQEQETLDPDLLDILLQSSRSGNVTPRRLLGSQNLSGFSFSGERFGNYSFRNYLTQQDPNENATTNQRKILLDDSLMLQIGVDGNQNPQANDHSFQNTSEVNTTMKLQQQHHDQEQILQVLLDGTQIPEMLREPIEYYNSNEFLTQIIFDHLESFTNPSLEVCNETFAHQITQEGTNKHDTKSDQIIQELRPDLQQTEALSRFVKVSESDFKRRFQCVKAMVKSRVKKGFEQVVGDFSNPSNNPILKATGKAIVKNEFPWLNFFIVDKEIEISLNHTDTMNSKFVTQLGYFYYYDNDEKSILIIIKSMNQNQKNDSTILSNLVSKRALKNLLSRTKPADIGILMLKISLLSKATSDSSSDELQFKLFYSVDYDYNHNSILFPTQDSSSRILAQWEVNRMIEGIKRTYCQE